MWLLKVKDCRRLEDPSHWSPEWMLKIGWHFITSSEIIKNQRSIICLSTSIQHQRLKLFSHILPEYEHTLARLFWPHVRVLHGVGDDQDGWKFGWVPSEDMSQHELRLAYCTLRWKMNWIDSCKYFVANHQAKAETSRGDYKAGLFFSRNHQQQSKLGQISHIKVYYFYPHCVYPVATRYDLLMFSEIWAAGFDINLIRI